MSEPINADEMTHLTEMFPLYTEDKTAVDRPLATPGDAVGFAVHAAIKALGRTFSIDLTNGKGLDAQLLSLKGN